MGEPEGMEHVIIYGRENEVRGSVTVMRNRWEGERNAERVGGRKREGENKREWGEMERKKGREGRRGE